MKKVIDNSYVFKIFIEWLKYNQIYFKHKLEIKCKHRDYYEFKYCDIIPEVRPIIKTDGIEVIIFRNEKVWDRLCWLDGIIPSQNKSGKYYDKYCIIKERKYYDSLKSLFFSECFEPFLKWSNENIISDNYLIYWNYNVAGGGAIITDKNNLSNILNKILINV